MKNKKGKAGEALDVRIASDCKVGRAEHLDSACVVDLSSIPAKSRH